MPFKSEAQRRKFAQLVKDGKMSKSVYDKWEKETPKGRLPERAPSDPPKVRTQRRVIK